jgi:spore coat protein F
MASIVNSFFKDMADTSADQTLALNGIAGAASAAGAYLNAVLQATTPEVRRLFGEYLTQTIMGQENLVGLALKKNWLNPYEVPENQIMSAYKQSQEVLGEERQQV